MSNSGANPFANNWAYLKTELRWLDRVLMIAVSRKRQDDKTLNQVANTPADKVTSHWWKGIVAVNRGIDDREGPPPKPNPQTVSVTVNYSQFLEQQIQASYTAGITLGLPLLRDRFALTEVEKNILLMAIAPEINRRYGRLYNFLQDEEGLLPDLPTIDLCLRLLCRNDQEWQQARARLTAPNSLVQLGIVTWIGDEEGTLLSQQVRIVDEVTRYLLADTPDLPALEQVWAEETSTTPLLTSIAPTLPETDGSTAVLEPIEASAIHPSSPETHAILSLPPHHHWETLILPKSLIRRLQYLVRQAIERPQLPELEGLIILLVGAAGTGKTLAAATLAAELGEALQCIDLETLSPDAYPPTLTGSPTEDTHLLLVKQGRYWFGRQPQVADSWLHQWWQWRKQFRLTLVSVHRLEQVRPGWRSRFDSILTFPRPDVRLRRRLWAQAFPPDFKTHHIDWDQMARDWLLTGGDITEIAQAVQCDLRSRQRLSVTPKALQDAMELRSFPAKIKGNPPKA
jgi:hypothetical protein